MAGRVTALATHFPTNWSSDIHRRRTKTSLLRASLKPPSRDTSPFLSQEDLKYVVKLGCGSVAGAAAIKYGSIIFPEITRPNLPLALLFIFAPVMLALFLLIKQSRIDSST